MLIHLPIIVYLYASISPESTVQVIAPLAEKLVVVYVTSVQIPKSPYCIACASLE